MRPNPRFCGAQLRLSLYYQLPILHTDHVSTFLYLEFDIFHAGASQWHFITSVLHAGKFPYANCHLSAKLFTSFLISTFISLTTNLPMKSTLRSGERFQAVVTIAVRIPTLSVHWLNQI